MLKAALSTETSFQSTLPIGERLCHSRSSRSHPTISIHTPHRGATSTGLSASIRCLISIHTPHRGATNIHQPRFHFFINFNPHSPSGSDAKTKDGKKTYKKFQSTLPIGERHTIFGQSWLCITISIHTPHRGATLTVLPLFIGS